MTWQVQLARAFVAAHLPGYDALRRFKRRREGYEPDLSNLGSTLHDVERLLRLLRGQGLSLSGRRVLEVGSGWFPLLPLIYRCLGAERVILTDISRNLDDGTLETARRFLWDNLPEIAGRLGFSPEQPWLGEGRDLEALGLEYRAPFDPADLTAPVDVVASRTVLEHIPPRELSRLSAEWLRMLAPGGFMLHAIDHSDHREHSDKRLSRIDFLTWSDAAWAAITRLGNHQWRLRHGDYHRLFAASGWAVLAEDTHSDPGVLETVRSLPLKYPFDTLYGPEELGIVASYLLLRPAAATPS